MLPYNPDDTKPSVGDGIVPSEDNMRYFFISMIIVSVFVVLGLVGLFLVM